MPLKNMLAAAEKEGFLKQPYRESILCSPNPGFADRQDGGLKDRGNGYLFSSSSAIKNGDD